MDKQQFMAVSTVLADGSKSYQEKEAEINEILGIDINDQQAAKALKEKMVGNETIIQTIEGDYVTVEFGDVETTGPSFGSAFITTLMMVIQLRALDKFLPQPKAAPETGSRSGASGSTASNRQLPITSRGY